MDLYRKNCPMRDEATGRCLPVCNGYCAAVPDSFCECFQQAYELGRQKGAEEIKSQVLTAKWILYREGSGVCSNCKRTSINVWDYDNWQRYCGCCGALMVGVETNEVDKR